MYVHLAPPKRSTCCAPIVARWPGARAEDVKLKVIHKLSLYIPTQTLESGAQRFRAERTGFSFMQMAGCIVPVADYLLSVQENFAFDDPCEDVEYYFCTNGMLHA